MQLLKKRVLAKVYSLIICTKVFFLKKNKVRQQSFLVDDILLEYKSKKK